MSQKINAYSNRTQDKLPNNIPQLSLLLDQMPVVLWTTDMDLRFTWSLGAGLVGLNLKPNQVVGMTLFEFFGTQDPEFAVIKAHRTAIKEGYVQIRAEWNGKTYECHIESLRGQDGQTIGTVGVALDITARQQQERQIQFQKTLLECQSEAGIDGILVVSEEGKMISFNRQFVEMWDLSPQIIESLSDDAAISSVLDKIVDPDHFLERIRYLYDHPDEVSQDEISLKDGKTIDRYSAPVRSREGDRFGRVWFFRDITAQKHAQEELRKMLSLVERGHNDMLSILNQLQLGVVMTDESGNISFINRQALRIFGVSHKEFQGIDWQEAFSFQKGDVEKIKSMFMKPLSERNNVRVHIVNAREEEHWIDVSTQNDPSHPERKIFFLYDVSEIYDLRRLLDERRQFRELIGESNSMQRVYQQIRELCRVDSTALIEGETGTGKELVARAIHFSSQRAKRPFIPVNCAGLTESLVNSQLFGHKRGAFTGAIEDHRGLFEAAHGGTIFLDEIGDIPLNVQTNLLRVLQEREITRLGESESRKIDVRVLAATQHDLNQEIAKGKFRSDLLYRIRVARVLLPSLRERREDIPLLIDKFLQEFRVMMEKPVQKLSNDALRVLMDYDWPGNVRELKSAIEFAVIRCKGSVIDLEDLPVEILDSLRSPLRANITMPTGLDEKSHLLAVLENAKGNRTVAARLLGISRATLYRRLTKLGLESKS